MARRAASITDETVDEKIEKYAEQDKAAQAAGSDNLPATTGDTPAERGEPFTPATTEEVIAEGVLVKRKGDLGLAEYLERYDPDDEDQVKEAAYASIIEQILSADSVEEVLTPAEAISAREVIGQPLVLHGFEVNTSDYDVGSPYYASMKCTRADIGENIVVNTGNQRIMAQLIRLSQLDGFPCNIHIREAKRPNRHGSFPLSLDSRPPETWR